jgi:hypothetical protein
MVEMAIYGNAYKDSKRLRKEEKDRRMSAYGIRDSLSSSFLRRNRRLSDFFGDDGNE